LEQLPADDFCTVALVEVDVEALRARVALAGHPLPLLARPGHPVREIGEPGQLLGAIAEPEIADADVDLEPDDVLLLYTDGVIEARDEHGQLGTERLVTLMEMLGGQPPAELTSRLLRAVNAFQAVQRDDIALVALRVMRERRAVPR
jgi:serine phosphatase RsbU (regulator of sigma subunit)